MTDNAFTRAGKQSGQKDKPTEPVRPLAPGSNAHELQNLKNQLLLLRETVRNQDRRIEEMWELVFAKEGFRSGFGSMVHIVKQMDKALIELRNVMIEVLTNPGEDVQLWVKRLNSYYTQFPEYQPKPEDLVDSREKKEGAETNGK